MAQLAKIVIPSAARDLTGVVRFPSCTAPERLVRSYGALGQLASGEMTGLQLL